MPILNMIKFDLRLSIRMLGNRVAPHPPITVSWRICVPVVLTPNIVQLGAYVSYGEILSRGRSHAHGTLG
jgi:hypothetical protein